MSQGSQESYVTAARPGLARHLRSRWLRVLWKHRHPYLFISPFYILFIIFGLFPILFALVLSFHEWSLLGPMEFAGLSNYLKLLTDPVFRKALWNTVYLLFSTNLPMLPAALVLAFILNSGLVRFADFFRAAYFSPIITSSVAVTIVFAAMFGLHYGLFNYVLTGLGLERIDWLGRAFWIKPAITLLVIWRWLGWNMVIYLAGLQGIPQDLYDAAKVDGAGLPQIFWYITIPLLKPVILFSVVITIIGTMQLFDEPFILTNGSGGTGNAGLTVVLFMYQNAFQFVRFGYAAATSYVLFVIILLFSRYTIRLFGGIWERD